MRKRSAALWRWRKSVLCETATAHRSLRLARNCSMRASCSASGSFRNSNTDLSPRSSLTGCVYFRAAKTVKSAVKATSSARCPSAGTHLHAEGNKIDVSKRLPGRLKSARLAVEVAEHMQFWMECFMLPAPRQMAQQEQWRHKEQRPGLCFACNTLVTRNILQNYSLVSTGRLMGKGKLAASW